VEAIDKHGSLCFLDSHHHPLPHKPQLAALGREMVVDEPAQPFSVQRVALTS
jgi:hypothetical protein